MPQMTFRKAVRSAAPAATITGATALPVSQRLRSDKKILRSSARLKFSTGLAAFTITTMGSPAAAGIASNRQTARIPARKRKDGFVLFVIPVSLEGKRELSRDLIPARFPALRIAVILQLHPCVFR
jgi:hypothetical protein